MVAKGKVIDIINVSENVTQVVIQSKNGTLYFPICFTAYKDVLVLIKQIRLEKKDVVKITYFLKSKKYENKYYTSAIIEKITITTKRPDQLMMVDLETGELY